MKYKEYKEQLSETNYLYVLYTAGKEVPLNGPHMKFPYNVAAAKI